jgi:hypothetical protein
MACHTITEELPSRPSAVTGVAGGTPTIIVQVPVPTPTPVPSTPVASPAPRTSPTPAPGATPTPEPNSGEQNRNPVARVACSVYFVECNGEIVPGSKGATSAQVGCRVHLDATTKDAGNDHTYRTEPNWVFSNPGMIERSGNSAWNPAITAKGPHYQSMYAEANGVRCDSFGINFH